jgi:WhiB family redox-sensing transcriptional regulator
MRDLTWLDRIACAGLDPDIFFPERAEAAKVVCRTCPVASQCQEFRKGEAGVWGGQSDRDRRKQRKENAAQTKSTRKG